MKPAIEMTKYGSKLDTLRLAYVFGPSDIAVQCGGLPCVFISEDQRLTMFDQFDAFELSVDESVQIYGRKHGTGPPLLLLHGCAGNLRPPTINV